MTNSQLLRQPRSSLVHTDRFHHSQTLWTSAKFTERQCVEQTDSDLSGHFSTQHVDRESSEVSHTAKTNLRSSISRKSMNSRMCIALNSLGTANFHPRPGQQFPGFWWLKTDETKIQNTDVTQTVNLWEISSPQIMLYKGQFRGPVKTKICRCILYFRFLCQYL